MFLSRFTTSRASPYGLWCDHVQGWRSAAGKNAGIRIYRFEDLRASPAAAVAEIAGFVGIEAGPAQIERALARNTSAHMRELERNGADYLRRTVGRRSPGVRDGVTGTWRQLLSEQHLHALAPLLEVSASFGYGAE